MLILIRKKEKFMKSKHLTLDERETIEAGLRNQKSFKEIAREINKDCTTISKEVKNHMVYRNVEKFGRDVFDCAFRCNCPYKAKGASCNPKYCQYYKKQTCEKLLKPPYVCNPCKNHIRCSLSKRYYDYEYAHREYKNNLVEVRSGVNFTEQELKDLDELLTKLIKEQGQSVHHAVINNKNSIMCSEKEIYNLIDMGILQVRNIDLPRKVRLRNTPKRRTYYKIDKKCLEGRRYSNFLEYIEENPDTNIVQMDSVEGEKGGKVLLTIHFVNCSFMLAFIRDRNTAQSVIDIFNEIEKSIGIEKFKELFPVLLTDNGSEFSNPKEIEFSLFSGEQRTKIFYCEPGRSDQKGSCEVNHELIRRILPKSTNFDELNQDDINLMMSHINSYRRKKLNNSSPYELFSLMYDTIILERLGITKVDCNDINLTTDLLK